MSAFKTFSLSPLAAALLPLLPLLALSATPASAQAQTSTQASEKATTQTTPKATPELAPVVVTEAPATALHTPVAAGSRLGLTAAQTPASVQTLTREQLQEHGDASITQAVTWSAGISASPHPGNGLSELSARGFAGSTSVMWLYDGLRQYGGLGITFPFDTWAIDRIEILRGPAAVIHGDGAIGGVVNVVPKKPHSGPIRHELQTRLGSHASRHLAYGSGGSLSERLSYRLDLSAQRSHGWLPLGDSRDASFSGALHWQASPTLALQLSHAQGRQRPARYFGTPLFNGHPDPALREQNYNVLDSLIRFRDRWSELAATWQPNAQASLHARLYHVDSWRQWRNAEYYTPNPASGLIDRSGNTQITHDQRQNGLTLHTRLQGHIAGLANTFSAGLDLQRVHFRHLNNTYAGSSGPVTPLNPNPGLFRSDQPFLPRYSNTASQRALFLENRLVLGPRWSLIAGLRHDSARVQRRDLISQQPSFTRRLSHTGWRLGAVHQLHPDLALYAQYASAADPASGLLMLSPANAHFDMTRGRQAEIGLKHHFWHGRGEWTLAAYHLRKNKLITRDPAHPDQRLQIGQSSARGLEATLALTPAPRWRIEANAALLRARYDDFFEPGSGGALISRQGKVPPNVPERSASLWLTWSPLPHWSLMGGLRHTGRRHANNANTLTLPAYTLADLALRWEPTPRLTLTAHAHNLLDKHHFVSAYYSQTQWLHGPGRQLELTLHYRF